jgi:hypothetical protein
VKIYYVLEPHGGADSAESAEAVRFIRDKFHWTALIFTPLWLIWHGLWLVLCGWLAATVAIAGVTYALGLSLSAIAITLLLPSLVVAFEGAELRRRKLMRAGFRDAGVALGEDLEDAERRFFAGWKPAANAPEPAKTSPHVMQPAAPRGVIGLFPEPGGGR